MKKKMEVLFGTLCAALLLAAGPGKAWASGTVNIQSYWEEQEWHAYVPAVAQVQKAWIQIGNEALVDASVSEPDPEMGNGIHTILLFDNSFSISEQNRDVLKEAAAQAIAWHGQGEMYSIATFDHSLHILAQESTDYESLQQLILQIEYFNQDTFLKDALHDAISLYGTGDRYTRFLVLSDGCDDNPLGYTYDEIKELLTEHNFPLYAIGSLYEGDIEALERLFSLARAARSPYYLIDEMEETDVIAQQLYSDAQLMLISTTFPGTVMDGGWKELRLTAETDSAEYEFYTKVQMPFGEVEQVPVERNDAWMPDEIELTEDEIPEHTARNDVEEDMLHAGLYAEIPDAEDSIRDTAAADPENINAQMADVSKWEETKPVDTRMEDVSSPVVPSDQWVEENKENAIAFFDQESLIPGVNNLAVCATGAFVLGLLCAVLFYKKGKSGSSETPAGEEDKPEKQMEFSRDPYDNNATVLLKTYPDPGVTRWNDR